MLIIAGGALGPVAVHAVATTASAAMRSRRSVPLRVAEVVFREAADETPPAAPRRGSGMGREARRPECYRRAEPPVLTRYCCWGVVSAGRCGGGLSGANRDS